MMENALLIGLSRQMALAREMDVIANNVANVNTNGFKGRDSRFAEHLMPHARADAFKAPDRKLSYVIDQGTALDLGQGSVERTGNPLDAAIRGPGFFAVQTPRGERYTRDGAFTIGANGALVTASGDPVLGEGGPITLGATETQVEIGADGTITTNLGQRGRLRIVDVADPQALVSEGANLFSSPGGATPLPPGPRVASASLERSNVKSVLEMTRLMEVSRSYTSIAGIVSKTDELRRTAIGRLADVPT